QNLSQTTIGYTDQAIGSASPQGFVSVTNGGNAPLIMQSVSIGGANPGDFALATNACASGFNMVPNDSCTVGVTFSPKAVGSRNATLTITSDAKTDVLPLSGNGVTPPDTAAPTLPTGVSAAAASTSSITVRWTASTDNVGVTGYRVYRDGAATPIGTPVTG